MKIGVLLASLDGGGAERVTLLLARSLATRGHQVDVALCRQRGPLRASPQASLNFRVLEPCSTLYARWAVWRADPAGFQVQLRPVLLPLQTSKTLHYFPGLAKLIRGQRYDALISAMPFLNLEALWAAQLAGGTCRVVVTEHTLISRFLGRRPGWRHRYLGPLVARTYKHAHDIISVSDGVADDLADFSGLKRELIHTIHNPVVTEDLQCKAGERLDHPWFGEGEPPVVLNVGRLADVKDHPTLLRAFASVRKQIPSRLVVLGEALTPKKTQKRIDSLMTLAAELGIREDVAFLGYDDNPFKYMARARVFASSSVVEGLGNVLIEALACGCPVVSTDCPSGPTEVLQGGAFGRLVPVQDFDAMAQALMETMREPVARDRLIKRSDAFSVNRIVDEYERVLTQNENQ